MGVIVSNGIYYSGSGGGGGSTTAILYYMTDNTAFEGYCVRVTGLLSQEVYTTILNSQGNGHEEVAGMEHYTLEFYYLDENDEEVIIYTTEFDANMGCFYYLPIGYDKTSWQGIQNILNAHKETELLEIGDEIHTDIGGVDTVFQIAGIDLYEAHEVIFIAKNIIENRTYNSSSSNSGGWARSALRTYLNGNFKDGLSSEIKNNLKLFTFKGGNGGSSPSIVTTEDYIWIPREYEISASSAQSYAGEAQYCRMYPIFSIAGQRIKTYNNSNAKWWTGSACWQSGGSSYATTAFAQISAGGGVSYANASSSDGVVPCFHFTAN